MFSYTDWIFETVESNDAEYNYYASDNYNKHWKWNYNNLTEYDYYQSSKSQNLSALWSPKWKFGRKFIKIQILPPTKAI